MIYCSGSFFPWWFIMYGSGGHFLLNFLSQQYFVKVAVCLVFNNEAYLQNEKFFYSDVFFKKK